jgi:hypothetical protein
MYISPPSEFSHRPLGFFRCVDVARESATGVSEMPSPAKVLIIPVADTSLILTPEFSTIYTTLSVDTHTEKGASRVAEVAGPSPPAPPPAIVLIMPSLATLRILL